MPHSDYLSRGKGETIDMDVLVVGSYNHVLVLMNDLSRILWYEKTALGSKEVAGRAELRWCASFGVPKVLSNDGAHL